VLGGGKPFSNSRRRTKKALVPGCLVSITGTLLVAIALVGLAMAL
jgi:hypothetical protein